MSREGGLVYQAECFQHGVGLTLSNDNGEENINVVDMAPYSAARSLTPSTGSTFANCKRPIRRDGDGIIYMRCPPAELHKLSALVGLFVPFILIAVSANAAEEDPIGPKLTPQLKDLIVQEMQLVLQASSEIHTAIVTGDHETVAEQSMKIHDSFIMKLSLTEQDKANFMKAVPPAFGALDAKLHEIAARLAHAAEQKDAELETVFFGKMTEACVACHSAYARDRFPSLLGTKGPPH
jgi:cytochrome c556